MILWVIAGSLALATGLRIGWALVNRQSLVSAAMMVALGSLTVLAALNWPPLAALVDSVLGWPNITTTLSLLALVVSATGSSVMITSVAAPRGLAASRRSAAVQYAVGALVAAVAVGSSLVGGREPAMGSREYLERTLEAGGALGWLVPLLYVLLTLTLASWVGLRLASPSRRGRALFVFSLGCGLLVAASALFALRAVTAKPWAGVGAAVTILTAAMVMVAAGALLPTVEDWIGARRERILIAALLGELQRRHRSLGIGERPRGPLVFQVAEQLSLISDGLYLEAAAARSAGRGEPDCGPPAGTTPVRQATTIARWVHDGAAGIVASFPGTAWLQQPDGYSDRDWILTIARQYRAVGSTGGAVAARPDSAAAG